MSESTIAKWPNGLLTVATRCGLLLRRPIIQRGGLGKGIQHGHSDASGWREQMFGAALCGYQASPRAPNGWFTWRALLLAVSP